MDNNSIEKFIKHMRSVGQQDGIIAQSLIDAGHNELAVLNALNAGSIEELNEREIVTPEPTSNLSISDDLKPTGAILGDDAITESSHAPANYTEPINASNKPTKLKPISVDKMLDTGFDYELEAANAPSSEFSAGDQEESNEEDILSRLSPPAGTVGAITVDKSSIDTSAAASQPTPTTVPRHEKQKEPAKVPELPQIGELGKKANNLRSNRFIPMVFIIGFVIFLVVLSVSVMKQVTNQ